MTERMKLLLKFLEIANGDIKTFPQYKPGMNFFNYTKCGVTKWFKYCESFSDEDINHAIKSIQTNNWDQSEFIMACENLGN